MLKKEFLITESNAGEYVEKIGRFLREHVRAAAREGAVLGMSGGLDSSVAARLCQKAGVPVLLVMLPDGAKAEKSEGMKHSMAMIDKF